MPAAEKRGADLGDRREQLGDLRSDARPRAEAGIDLGIVAASSSTSSLRRRSSLSREPSIGSRSRRALRSRTQDSPVFLVDLACDVAVISELPNEVATAYGHPAALGRIRQ